MNAQEHVSSEISLASIVRAIWRGKWWIVLLCVVSVAAMVLAYTKLPRMYRAEAVVMPAETAGGAELSGSVAGLAALAGVPLDDSASSMEEAIAILESSQFIREFIEDNLSVQELFFEEWDSEANRWHAEVEENPPSLNDAEEYFSKDVLSIRRLPKGQALQVSITWVDRTIAAEWANALIARINQTMRQRALVSAQESLSYLEAELDRVTVLEVRQGIFGLIEDQIKRMMLANVKPQYAFKIIDPAVVPDEDNHYSPRLLIMLIGGVFFGFMMGSMIALIRAWQTGRL